jgi:hypothetical protein
MMSIDSCLACYARKKAENTLRFSGTFADALIALKVARKLDHAPGCTYIPRHDESFVPPLHVTGKSDAS